MTLLELLIAVSILVGVAGTLGVLAKGVEDGFEYTEGHGTATQHARVAMDRIARSVREATANEQFPGVLVIDTQVDGYRLPDTLVVWHPDGEPVEPDGLPRINELVIYCPDPSAANRLVELRAAGDTGTVPPPENLSEWRTTVASIKADNAAQMVTLTKLVRTASVANAMDVVGQAAVRFETRLRPSAQQWKDYKDGNTAWEDLPWVQGIYGSQTGLRQVWLRTELQLLPDQNTVVSAEQAIPFFGSAALYYEMHQ